MNKEFVPYEQALALKELGFNEPCLGYYRIFSDGDIKLLVNSNSNMRHLEAPLYQQAFKWFREKYKIISSTRTHLNEKFFYEIYVDAMNEITYNYYNTYEEGELACLKKLIDIVKNK